jgi:hypothetical protein
MSKFKTKEFKQLHRAWMDKLKDEGFKDIEDVNSPLEMLKTWDSMYFLDGAESFSEVEEYYQIARELLNTHDFDSAIEKIVWEFHSEGMSVRAIELKLIESKIYAWEALALGKNLKAVTKLNKDAINVIIQRLQKFIGRR